MAEMNEQMLNAYLDEAQEQVEELNSGMLQYEQEGDEDGIERMFRASHTLKSSSASMGFDDVSELAHKMEDVFDELRDGNLEADEKLYDLLYRSIDTLEEMVDQVEEKKEAPDIDGSELIDKLKKARDGEDFELEQEEQQEEEFEGVSEIKVSVEKLDRLMNLVGELMIREKEIAKIAEEEELEDVSQKMDDLMRLGEDIRNEVSDARMIPVSQVFDRFPRTVRDLSKRTDKKVSLDIVGSELRMDRTIIEELGEPLIHIMRNAVDHGIEPPEERREAGKPETGQITLKAEKQGNEAIISVEDDGRGIDTSKVVDKAVENGVISRQRAENLSRQDKMELLFNSDMSTNEEVTELSGRGVGLSVVKRTAKELHGSYSIESERGEGTRIAMKLPLSLAVTRCFLVDVCGSKFGIPINVIRRALRLQDVDVKKMEGNDVFIYEEENVPLVDLKQKLDIESEKEGDIIVLVEVANERVGVRVDDILDVQDFVSKDLDLIDAEGMSGVTMLSDGTPLIILDIPGLMDVE